MGTLDPARSSPDALALEVLEHSDRAVIVRELAGGRLRFANSVARVAAGRGAAVERLDRDGWRVRTLALGDELRLVYAEPPRASVGALVFDLANQLALDSNAIELMLALLDGQSAAEIARRLGVSRSTVNRRCEAICRCAGCVDGRQLTEIAEIYLEAMPLATLRSAAPEPYESTLSQETSAAACDALPDALVVLSPGGGVLFANQAAQELFGEVEALPAAFSVDANGAAPLVLLGWPFAFMARHHGRYFNVRVHALPNCLRLVSCRINAASDYPLLERIKQEFRITDRQTDLLRCVLRNASTDETATTLRLSSVTVRRHRSEMLHRLGVRTRGQLLQLLASLRD